MIRLTFPCSMILVRHRSIVGIALVGTILTGIRAQAEEKESKGQRIAKVRADLKSDEVATRRKAIMSQVHSDISEMLFPEMQAALKDADGEVRSTAATAIGNLGEKAVPAVPALIAGLQNDTVKEARETAARALGRIGKAAPKERSAVEPLKQTSQKDDDPVTRVVALGALAMMDVGVPQQITELRKYLHHDDGLTRMKAAHALGGLGTVAKAAAPEIVEVLERETDHHRLGYVARALGNTGDPASLPALYAALENETHPGSIGEIRGAIARLGGKVPDRK
jgi:HEAT repeat protein